jgi:quercetin dioxygenase-like cupin family protein
MIIFQFDESVGNRITMYDSNFVMSRIIRTETPVSVGCMHLGKNGLIGRHKATCPQLLLVVDGKGEVSGQDQKKHKIKKGEAAYWDTGEDHETTTGSGLTAIVIESDQLDPAKFMIMKK